MTSVEAAIHELMAFPTFADMSRERLLQLSLGSRVQVLGHREVLYRMSDLASSFGIVLGGAFKLTKLSPMGEDVIVHFSTPGDVIGAFIMAQPNSRYPVSAIAMGTSRILTIPRETYLQVWKQNTDLIFRIQNLLSSRITLLQNQKMMSRSPLAQRLANLFINLLDQCPSAGEDLLLPLPLTRKEIADNLGSSVEAVIRIMSDWSKAGYIATTEKQIRVIRSEKLVNLSLGME